MRLQGFIDALSRLQQRHALLLFLAFGAGLFALESLRAPATVLTVPAATAINSQTAAQWLEEEVLYREALARGLNQGDVIVRRRLVQKMRMLLETGVEVAEPSEDELRRWIDTYAGRYGGVQQVSFDHVFLSRGLRDSRLAEDARAVRQELLSGGEKAGQSDPHPGGTRQDNLDARGLERLFGSALAEQIADLPPGRWQGPLRSPLGLHFVRVVDRQLRTPDYHAVRERAHRDYLLEARRLATASALDRLKVSYGLAPAAGAP